MDARDGRLSAGYLHEVLRLANGGADEVPVEPGRLAPDYASVDAPPAAAIVHGRLSGGYVQAVAEFLASA